MNEFTKNAVIATVTVTICLSFLAMVYFAFVGLLPVETISTIIFSAVASVISVVLTHLSEKRVTQEKLNAVSAKYEGVISTLGAALSKDEGSQ